ncbi:hypothetical protein [Paenibacillus sp. ISL-20]|uniref:hypothetical protein n=1 Tax=Paenibacillus sp. ISL-20 TaxID=2819163 RepID=UPI001BE8D8F6|nr:hypothetical protein [Paenibacillus sp. ISL-20]MBT2759861.1 hypothetical protein [Paenibacillus sp. ISL-20]
MTEDEYWKSNEDYENQEDNYLPSSFLSDEDIPGETNVLIIPNYKLNVDLILNNYVEHCSKAKTKEQLKQYLFALWEQASLHGALSERLDKLQTDIEMLQIDLMHLNGYEIEFVDEEDE